MSKFRVKFALVLLAAAATVCPTAFAQTAAEKPSVDTRRVGAHLRCQCGCPDSVATCAMLECSFSKPAKERIAQMQTAGTADQQIIDAFIANYGPGIYLAPPSAFGWAIPYAAAGLGLLVIGWFLATRKPRPLPELAPISPHDPALDKYKDQIEKDLANFDDTAYIVVASLLAIVVVAFLLRVRPQDLPAVEPPSPFRHLDERKASIYENLRDLQFEYRLGKLSDADYQHTKQDLQKMLAAVMAEVDQIKTQQPAPMVQSIAPKQAAPILTCPHCNAKFEKELKFCGECGKSMKVAAS